MRLNNKGFAPKSFFIAIGALLLCALLIIPRNNDYADIPPMKAAKAATSDDGKVQIRLGEEFSILGVDKAYSTRDKKKNQLMLLVQNSRGERDIFNPDLISEEQLQEILPALKHSEYSNSPAIFCRKTVTKKTVDAIPLGITTAEMDDIFVPTGRIITEEGFQTAKYLRMEVFDKETGKFFTPYMKFKDGKYCGCDYREPERKHMNPWLLKFLPGTNWVYDHNIFNAGAQKKAFGRLWIRTDDDGKVLINKDSNFLVKLMGIAMIVLMFVVIFGFYAFIPMLPACIFYGLLLFPPLFKPFSRTLVNIILWGLTIVSYYYCWLTFMPYMSFFIMPVLMIPAARFMMDKLTMDDICSKCRYMNTKDFDHKELLREYDTERDESRTDKIGSRVTGKRETWDETVHTTKNAYTGEVVNQYTTKDNVKKYTDYEDTFQTDNYHRKYHVKVWRNYYRCTICGNITTMDREEWQMLSSTYLGSNTSTRTRTEQH